MKHLKTSTPVVVFAHIPLWAVYPEWGWGTDDSAQALGYPKRFGSVTVLNGHIHQVMQKIEGNVTFHTACSTAFPQPNSGSAPSPGPMKVPAEQLRAVLGMGTRRAKAERNSTDASCRWVHVPGADCNGLVASLEVQSQHRCKVASIAVGVGAFGVAVVTITGHLGGFLSGVNHP